MSTLVVPTTLVCRLLSGTTFGRGEGTAGEVDIEVEHDADGIPFLGGKTLHGLLRDSWSAMQSHFDARFAEAGRGVFGAPGETGSESSILRIGDAHIDLVSRKQIAAAVRRGVLPLHPKDVLRAFTEVRKQTAIDEGTEVASEGSLRASRVVLRDLKLNATLRWLVPPTERHVAVLAAACLATRHGGLVRHRGRGHLEFSLDDDLAQTVTCIAPLEARQP